MSYDNSSDKKPLARSTASQGHTVMSWSKSWTPEERLDYAITLLTHRTLDLKDQGLSAEQIIADIKPRILALIESQKPDVPRAPGDKRP